MEKQVKISPIIIYSAGDPSVGIFSTIWSIKGDIYLYEEDIEDFREKLKVSWKYIADDAIIIFNCDEQVSEWTDTL